MIRLVPSRLVPRVAFEIGKRIPMVRPSLAEGLSSNLRRVCPDATPSELAGYVEEGFGSYGRYWADTLRLPSLTPEIIDRGFEVEGYGHIIDCIDAGLGPIMVLPHVGGWEWAAAWLGRVAQIPVTAVVERLEPADVFEWFADLRQSYGISIVPLGPGAARPLLRAIKDGHVVCLLADRDIEGGGQQVEFFGHRTTVPSGPALLAARSGTVLLPTVVYFRGSECFCRVGAPIRPDTNLPLRQAVAETTQTLTSELEKLIAAQPGQWHVLQPNWPDLT